MNSNSHNVSFVPLGELYPNIRNGFVGTVTPFFSTKDNGILYLRGTNIHDGSISTEDIVYVSKDFHKKHSKTELKTDDIIMVQSGHVGECAVVGEKYAGANCHALIVMSNGGKCNSEYRLISHLIDTRSFILFLLSSVSIISVITALIQLLRLMKTMTLRVFDSTIIRNKAIYCHPEEESALFLIYAYTNATVELEKRISEKQKKYDSVIWKLIASLLAYAAFILLQKGL